MVSGNDLKIAVVQNWSKDILQLTEMVQVSRCTNQELSGGSYIEPAKVLRIH